MGDCLVKPGTGRSHVIRDIIMCIALIFADIPAQLLKAFSVYRIWFKIHMIILSTRHSVEDIHKTSYIWFSFWLHWPQWCQTKWQLSISITSLYETLTHFYKL